MKTHLLLSVLAFTLTASGAVAPFAGAGSNYGGIIEATATDDPNNSGILTVVMNDFGSASLALIWQGQTYRLKGTFTGNFSSAQLNKTDIPKKGPQTPGTKLALFCTLDSSSRTISGVVSDPEAPNGGIFSIDGNPPDTTAAAQLDSGLRMAFIDDAVAPAPREGPQRTGLALPPTGGNGFTVVTIGTSSRRSNRSAGRLADEQPFTAGSPLRSRNYALRGGLYPQGSGLPAGGQVLGNSTLSTTAAAPENGAAPRSLASLIAALRWHKRPNLPKTNSFPGGFDGRVNLDTVPYSRDRDVRFILRGERANFSNASIIISGGPLATDVTVPLNLTIFGAKIAGANPNNVKLFVHPLAARFDGSFKPDPVSKERVAFHGALRSSTGVQPTIVPGEGKGSFLRIDRLDPANSMVGSVRIKAQ